jgi:hypothetical protein
MKVKWIGVDETERGVSGGLQTGEGVESSLPSFSSSSPVLLCDFDDDDEDEDENFIKHSLPRH